MEARRRHALAQLEDGVSLHKVALPLRCAASSANPEVGVWSHANRTLANGRPDDHYSLHADVRASLVAIRNLRRFLRGCVTGSGLPPSLN